MIINGGFYIMGSKRIGLARTQALIENLKRELNLADSTLEGGATMVWDPKSRPSQYNFAGAPVCTTKVGTAGSGTDDAENIWQWSDGLSLTSNNIGTQTLFYPVESTSGCVMSGDATNDEGLQWAARSEGARGELNKDYFTVGTSPAFFMSVTFTIDDVSGTDDCAVGFRKVEAFQAAIDDYDEGACMNVISGDIYIETILNNGTTTATDTTDNWADAASHELKVLVSAAGVVTFQIDGAAPTATAAFTFDNGEHVTPCGYHLNATDLATITYTKMKYGLQ
tara:strand:+ start:234 stop:1076 length:843 start_codon:yes stop_codon:yes gene_type:complete